jgi:V-type H+-transporting ATPase subunit a
MKVMFGDMGHGFLLFLFGLFLCFRKEHILKNPKSSFRPLIRARYLLALMGFFGLYCGFIYNDFISIPMNFFGSCYDHENINNETK